MKKTFYHILVLGLLIGSSCKETPKNTVTTEPVVFTKEGELSIYKQEIDSLITTIDIEFAQSEYETQTGLMYRKSMEEKQGMLFIFPDSRMHSFYMKNTEFALDLIFIDEDLKIASFQENAKPLDESGLSSKVPVKYVLEVNAGLVKKRLLEIGDKITYSKN